MNDEKKIAVVLLSGGLDSATTLAVAKDEGFCVHALSFRYGQRHEFELEAARKVARQGNVEKHSLVDCDLRQFGGSALTGNMNVPKHRTFDDMEHDIPITYVPARNTIFLAFALAFAETSGSSDIFIGVNAVDYSGYPDCRSEYIRAFETMANLATRAGVEGKQKTKIHTPLIEKTKAQIIQTGLALGVDYSLTHTCYDPGETGLSCGLCDACQLRLKGFAECGIPDPLPYQTKA